LAGALDCVFAGGITFAAVFATGSTAFEAVPVTAWVTGARDSVVAPTTDPTPPSVFPHAEPLSVSATRIAPNAATERRSVAADAMSLEGGPYPEALAA
jgi:hypothetical protein